MMFRNKLATVMTTTALLLSPYLSAEPMSFERNSSLSLQALTNNVHQRIQSQQQTQAQQHQVDANTQLSQALFADTATVNLNHFNDAIGSSDGLQEWEASVDLPLWLPGQKQQQSSLSATLAAEIPAYQQRLLLDASAQVRQLVWQLELANTEEKQRLQAWTTAQQLEKNVALRVSAGELASTESLLASSHVLEMQSQYLQAQSKLRFSLQNYQQQTGEQAFPTQVEEGLSTQLEITGQHPYLALLEQQASTLRSQQELARFDGAQNPNLTVGLKRERGDNDESFNNSVGLGISFALGNDVYRNPNIATAATLLADVDIARIQLERKLQSTLLEKRHTLQAKQQQLGLAEVQQKTAEQYLFLQQRAFDLGEIDLVSLLRSQALANDAQNRKSLLAVNVKAAIAEVNQSLGIVL